MHSLGNNNNNIAGVGHLKFFMNKYFKKQKNKADNSNKREELGHRQVMSKH